MTSGAWGRCGHGHRRSRHGGTGHSAAGLRVSRWMALSAAPLCPRQRHPLPQRYSACRWTGRGSLLVSTAEEAFGGATHHNRRVHTPTTGNRPSTSRGNASPGHMSSRGPAPTARGTAPLSGAEFDHKTAPLPPPASAGGTPPQTKHTALANASHSVIPMALGAAEAGKWGGRRGDAIRNWFRMLSHCCPLIFIGCAFW